MNSNAVRDGWIGSDGARDLALTRLELAREIERLSPPARGMRHACHRTEQTLHFVQRKPLVCVGGAYVYKSTHGDKPCWYVVDVASGMSFASFGKACQARALCAALGPRVGDYFARAASGDARAATTIARLTRIHSTRARSSR